MFVVTYRKVWFALSALLLAVSIFGMVRYGFHLSIDFKGGSITEVKYADAAPSLEELNASVEGLKIGGFSVRPSTSGDFVIRTKQLNTEEQAALLSKLKDAASSMTVIRQNTVGPIAGAELQSKAVKAVLVVIVMIVLFITFAFRKVGKPVSSWKYGFATIVALAHDVIIPLGIFTFLGHFVGYEIDLLFVTGLLAILGYSVHDTIVVFDRVRENLMRGSSEPFEETVGKSVTQTFGRSINTSLTIFITLLALFLYGSTATKEFALLLIIGVIIGTYSSIFVASPLLVTFATLGRKK